MKSLVSIIIPVYNVEAYLEASVFSVLNQTYRELEIILVDDGSTDRSGILCDEFEKKDDRVIVIHQKNKGLSGARNTGISQSRGKYIYFLDSDDILAEDVIEILVSLCEKHHAGMAVTGLKHFKKHIPTKRDTESGIEVFSGEEAVRRMLGRDDFCHEAQGKLYLKEFWGQFTFPEGMRYEDYAIIYDVVVRAEKVVYYKQPKYYYRVREHSITRSHVQEEDFVLLDISDSVTQRIISWNPAFEKDAVSMQMATYLKLMKRILDTGFYQYPETQKRIVTFVEDRGRNMLKWDEIRILDKVKIITLLLDKRIFYLVYRFGDFKNSIFIRLGI